MREVILLLVGNSAILLQILANKDSKWFNCPWVRKLVPQEAKSLGYIPLWNSTSPWVKSSNMRERYLTSFSGHFNSSLSLSLPLVKRYMINTKSKDKSIDKTSSPQYLLQLFYSMMTQWWNLSGFTLGTN